MHTIYLALGSNLGNKEEVILHAVDELKKHISNIRLAPLYQSKAMYVQDQPDFVNTVLKGTTNLSPHYLLTFLKEIEQHLGRIHRLRFGPREIDIDILFFDDMVFEDEKLQIPHPRLAERDFVLVPLHDIAPDLIHPVLRKTVSQLLQELPEDQKSVFKAKN